MHAICRSVQPTYNGGAEMSQGQKSAFGLLNVAAIAAHLTRQGNIRDLSLFLAGIDTCLRSVDLLALRVRDVRDHRGNIRPEFATNQRKLERGGTGKTARKVAVKCMLTPRTQAALALHVAGKHDDALLFPITCGQLRRLVKQWASAVELDPATHAAHSLRRTLPSAVYAASHDLEACRYC